MNRGAFIIIWLFFTVFAYGQVGINTTDPDPAAILDIQSEDKGVLIPRVDIENLDDINPITGGSPVGLLVYNTNTSIGEGFYYWTGTQWSSIDGSRNWSKQGNSGTNPANNFIGTTDNQPLPFRVNNIERMGILTNGNVGMGGYFTDVKLNVVGGTNYIGVLTSNNNEDGYALYAENQNTSSSTGIIGIGNGSTTYFTGAPGTGIAGTAAGSGYGVMGAHFNDVSGSKFGILGAPYYGVYSNFASTNYGWMNSEDEGLYTQRNNNNFTILSGYNEGIGWNENFGVIAYASGGTYNTGLIVASGETVISAHLGPNSNSPQLIRSYNGSIFLQRGNNNGRIYFTVGNNNYYVNNSGQGDYSEYFKTSDRTLGVGEIVAMDPNNASGVRRARPSDISKTVGIVSFGGTRNNDNIEGTRGEDPNYVNVGLLGQVPVLVSTENGDIKPGDPLTLSKTYRGRAVKATESCRIIGYALTHFPYVSGEQTFETDINGTDKLRLKDNHVMCYVNPGWYEPADVSLGDGIEIIPSESAFDMITRVNIELDNENPNKGLIRDASNLKINKENKGINTLEKSTKEIFENHQTELNSLDVNDKN